MKKTVSNKKKKNNAVLIIIMAAILLIVLGLFARNLIIDSDSVDNNLVQVPRIVVSVKSSEDDSNHTLKADFYIDAEETEQLSSNKVHEAIMSVLQGIDYNELTEKDSLKNINKLVKDKLNEVYPDANIKNVYAKNFVTDIPIYEPTTGGNSVNDKLKQFEVK